MLAQILANIHSGRKKTLVSAVLGAICDGSIMSSYPNGFVPFAKQRSMGSSSLSLTRFYQAPCAS